MTDILTGLTTGMLDALPTPPLAALAFQWYKQTPYMLDIGLTPLVGATVISKKVWDAIPQADRVRLSEVAARIEKQLQADVPKQDTFAVALMSGQGLKVIKATGPEWRREADVLAKTVRGQMVPPDIFDLATKARDAFRAKNPSTAPK